MTDLDNNSEILDLDLWFICILVSSGNRRKISMRIRKATPSDAEAIMRMHKSSIQEICKTSYTPDQILVWTEALQLDRYVQGMELLDFYVAEDEGAGKIAGFLIVDSNVGEINALYIAPSAVEQGLGKKLLSLAERMIQERGHKELRLKSTLNAEAFYQHHGFERTACSLHCLCDDRELPCLQMRKHLD